MALTTACSNLFCFYEDRASEEAAVRLAIASLRRNVPDARVHLRYPPAGDPLKKWLSRYPGVTLTTEPLREAAGWNVKAIVMQQLLEQGEESVCWIDVDILTVAPLPAVLTQADSQTIVVTQETPAAPLQGTRWRARRWNLTPARELGVTVNTCVLRLTPAHLPVVKKYRELLNLPEYQATQSAPLKRRPFWMVGDSDVFSALVGSDLFAQFPVALLRSGRDIVQHFGPSGYSVGQRLSHLFTGHRPTFIHAQGDKPWAVNSSPPLRPITPFVKALIAEQSLYTVMARQYADEIDMPAPWLQRRTKLGRLLQLTELGRPPLSGMALATGKETIRLLKDHRPRRAVDVD